MYEQYCQQNPWVLANWHLWFLLPICIEKYAMGEARQGHILNMDKYREISAG